MVSFTNVWGVSGLLQAAWAYIENAVPFILIALPFVIVWRVLSALITARSRKCTFRESLNILREIFMLMFSVYVVWLASQTVIPHMEWVDGGFVVDLPEIYVTKYNIVPFAAIWDAVCKIFVDVNLYYVIYLVGNIIVFIPLGFFNGLLGPKNIKAWQAVMISFFVSAFIETIQIFLPRMVDIDDVILNTAGGFIGYALFVLLQKFAPGFVIKVKN